MAHDLPESLSIEYDGPVAIATLRRPQKRNALDDVTIRGLGRLFADLGPEVKAAVIDAEGPHFSAGLDLSMFQGSEALGTGSVEARGRFRAKLEEDGQTLIFTNPSASSGWSASSTTRCPARSPNWAKRPAA